MTDIKKLKGKAQSRGIGSDAPGGGYARHILFCAHDGCCKGDSGETALCALRKRLREIEKRGGPRAYCTPVERLQVCRNGPLAVVYPEGTWYHDLTPERCERIADEHIARGAPVEEAVFAHNPLTTAAALGQAGAYPLRDAPPVFPARAKRITRIKTEASNRNNAG